MEAAKQSTDLSKVSLRDIKPTDIPLLVSYWYDSDPKFMESIGMDSTRFPPVHKLESQLARICSNPDKSALIIQYDNQAVGHHILTYLKHGESALIHGHLWDVRYRGQGIVSHVYPKACQIFFNRFKLKKLIFEVYANNAASIRVKHKIGAKYVGQAVNSSSIGKVGALVKTFELINKKL